MDCSLRIKFYPSKFFFNKIISVAIIVLSKWVYAQRDFEVFEVYWLGFCRNIPRQSYSDQSEAVLWRLYYEDWSESLVWNERPHFLKLINNSSS